MARQNSWQVVKRAGAGGLQGISALCSISSLERQRGDKKDVRPVLLIHWIGRKTFFNRFQHLPSRGSDGTVVIDVILELMP